MPRTDRPGDQETSLRSNLPVKTAVTLSAAAAHKLRAAALHEGKTQSQLVEALVLKHLGGYFTSKRAGGEEKQGETVPMPGVRAG